MTKSKIKLPDNIIDFCQRGRMHIAKSQQNNMTHVSDAIVKFQTAHITNDDRQCLLFHISVITQVYKQYPDYDHITVYLTAADKAPAYPLGYTCTRSQEHASTISCC